MNEQDQPSPQNTLAPCPQEKWTMTRLDNIVRGAETPAQEWAMIIDAHNASLAPCPIKDEGEETELLFRSSVSGLWYSNPNAAGSIDRVKVGEVQFAFVTNDLGETEAPTATTGKGPMEILNQLVERWQQMQARIISSEMVLQRDYRNGLIDAHSDCISDIQQLLRESNASSLPERVSSPE